MFRLADPRRWELPRLAGWPAAARREEAARACHELRGSLTAARLGLGGGGEGDGGVVLSAARLRAIELELEKAVLALDDLTGARERVPGRVVSMTPRCIDLRALLDDTVEAWRGAAAGRQVELGLCWPGTPVSLRGDRLRLAQAVGNLIANAIEHGAGPVEVSVRADERVVRIEVIDGGTGLPVPVEALTQRSRRGRGARGRGLAIAAAIAAAHGGRLAGAPSDRGARLVLELPRQRVVGGAERSDRRPPA